MLYAILDAVVDGYAPVVVGLANDIDEIESRVLGGDPGVSHRIYELSREVIDFERAVRPLTLILEYLSQGFEKYGIGVDLQQYLGDVADHVVNATDRVEETRKISAWAAILFAPSLVTGIYGMNFSNMPELTWQYRHTIAIASDADNQCRAFRDLSQAPLAVARDANCSGRVCFGSRVSFGSRACTAHGRSRSGLGGSLSGWTPRSTQTSAAPSAVAPRRRSTKHLGW